MTIVKRLLMTELRAIDAAPTYEVDDLVVARHEVTERGIGTVGDPDAEFPDPAYIHAVEGDRGTVVHINCDGYPTVRFERTGTATIVHPDEVRHV